MAGTLIFLGLVFWMYRILGRPDVADIFRTQPRPRLEGRMSLTRFLLMVMVFFSVFLTFNRFVGPQKERRTSDSILGAPDFQGDHDAAIAFYTGYLHNYPKIAGAYNNRGNAWKGKGEYDKALADYDEAIRLEPEIAVFYRNRADTNHRDGRRP